VFIDHDDAADLLLVHQLHRFAQRRVGLQVTGWRMANSPRRVFSEYWVPRVSTAFAGLAG
jgi:hypothetical protein